MEAENHLVTKHASHSAAEEHTVRLLESHTTPAVGAGRRRLFFCSFCFLQLTSLLPGESDGRARMAMPGSGHGLLRNHSWTRCTEVRIHGEDAASGNAHLEPKLSSCVLQRCRQPVADQRLAGCSASSFHPVPCSARQIYRLTSVAGHCRQHLP
jgi:hypothetical protein